jgi:GTPase
MSQSIEFKLRDGSCSADLIALEHLASLLLHAIEEGDAEAALLIAVSLRRALELSAREYEPFARDAIEVLQRRVAHDRAKACLSRAPARLYGTSSVLRFLARFRDGGRSANEK